MEKKIGILFSGGLESSALLDYYLFQNYSVELLYIKVGFIWEETEYRYATKIARHYNCEKNLHCLDLSSQFKPHQLGLVKAATDNIIPIRNMTLLTFATNYFFYKNIYTLGFGLQGSKDYPDTSLEYITKVEDLLSIGLQSDFKIIMPFYGYTKQEIKDNCTDFFPMNLIFSCTNPVDNRMCENCYKCKKLREVLH